jgi:hypothetical protein
MPETPALSPAASTAADSLAELRSRLTVRRRQLLDELATGQQLDPGFLVLLGHVHLALAALDAEAAP